MQDDRSASVPIHLRSRRRRLLLPSVAGAVVALAFVACKHAHAPRAAISNTTAARLVIFNEGASEWAVTATPLTGGEARAWHLSRGASLSVELPAGNYAIEQTLIVERREAGATRRFTMTLEPGQAYGWQLVNLLAGVDDEASQERSAP